MNRFPPDYGSTPIGRNPQDAVFLAHTRQNSVTPFHAAGMLANLLSILSPPDRVSFGGQQRRANAGMVLTPEAVAARFGASHGLNLTPASFVKMYTGAGELATGGKLPPEVVHEVVLRMLRRGR